MENKQLAQGIASLGRYGDTTLMHMRPDEVQQLTAISRANGGDITINPDTGMPEAFLGNFLKAAAPIAAGYFTGGAGTSLFGLGATGSAIAAGALTGAGIAALSGDNILGGAFTGGLGGLSGGAMGTAAQATKAAEIEALKNAGATTAEINAVSLGSAVPPTASAGSFNPALTQSTGLPPLTGGANIGTNIAGNPALQTGFKATAPMAQGPNMGFVGQTQKVAGGGGYNPSAFGRGVEGAQAAFREPGEFLSQLGDGSKAMGAGKLGLTGLGVAGQAGAFDVEPIDIGPREEERYDPNRRLNLNMDTGIGGSLRRDTGLRLLAQGGMVNNYANGGPAMYGMTPAAPPPKYGIIDVGGKFVETSKEPGPGLISDSDFKEQYQTTTAEKNQQGGGGGGMDPNLAPGGQGDDAGLNPGAISALASGFAQQQTNPPTKSQTLGLEALAGGGYLETGGEVGDGMSDEIEATIEGEQEARLSDGEFVIPADVVSHLGNGSSDAGAKRLYEMMDKIRMARTGTKKQGKEINPERYMPA
jgi:hypothetical protein